MASINVLIDKIKDEQIGASSKRVLVLEGTDDVQIFGHFLRHRSPGWEQHWVLAYANGKKRVLEVLQKEPTWLGVVDCDEWESAECARKIEQYPNLMCLPRYCIESYLVDPDELWALLPRVQQQKIAGGLPALRQLLMSDFHRWVNHGALWAVVNPMMEKLNALGFKGALLNIDVASDDARIQQKLQVWHDFFIPAPIFQDVQDKRAMISGLPLNQQLIQHIHGKQFFETVVVPVLNRALRQQNKKENWLKDLFKGLPAVPADLDLIWQKMGL